VNPDCLPGAGPPAEPDRVLATILLARAAGGGAGAPGIPGPLTGREAVTRTIVHAHRGRWVQGSDQDMLATFDAPGQAIRCAASVRDTAAAAGIRLACGIHTGEIDRTGDDIAGTAVHIAAGVAALARPAEILVSRTVKDLLTGSGIAFAARGSHQLTGTTDRWPLFAVATAEPQ
jgi:class 3 adenylate cyclase